MDKEQKDNSNKDSENIKIPSTNMVEKVDKSSSEILNTYISQDTSNGKIEISGKHLCTLYSLIF